MKQLNKLIVLVRRHVLVSPRVSTAARRISVSSRVSTSARSVTRLRRDQWGHIVRLNLVGLVIYGGA